MRRYLTIDGLRLIDLGLTINEGLVLFYLEELHTWATSKEIEGKTFYLLFLEKLINDLPYLDLSEKSFRTIISSLIKKKIIKRVILENAQPYYFIEEREGWKKVLGGTGKKFHPIERDNIIKTLVGIQELGVDEAKIIQALSSLGGETNEKDWEGVTVDNVIDLRNNYSSQYKLTKIQGTATVLYNNLKSAFKKVKSKFTKEEFNKGMENYFKEIDGRQYNPSANSYYNHRFQLLAFLKQGNGLEKYIYL